MTEFRRQRDDALWGTPLRAHPNIAIVAPNPAMDRTEEIDGFRPAEVNRAHATSPRAGGKGFIVARALRRLGKPVTIYGFLGGAIGTYIRDECAKLGIADRHTEVRGVTRINTILVDSSTRHATVVNEPGPEIAPDEVRELKAGLSADLCSGDLMVLTGSLPIGVDDGLYAELVSIAAERGVRTIVDADDEVLVRALTASPWAIKCNLAEFHALVSDIPHAIASVEDRQRVLDAAHSLARDGVGLVIVTLGAAGLVAATATSGFDVTAAPVCTKNATGSGDTFLAGFVSAIATHAPLESALRLGAAAASANASQLVPDIGASPRLESLVELVSVTSLTIDSDGSKTGHVHS